MSDSYSFSGFDSYADSSNVGGAYGSTSTESDPVNDPFSYYDPATGGYSPGVVGSPSTEGDYGFTVFNAIDKLGAGQPLTKGELQALTDAGLGGMTSASGRTVSQELSASSAPPLTGQQINDILYGSLFNIDFGKVGSLFAPPAPVDESGPGGVSVSEERTSDYAPSGFQESGPGGVSVSEERTRDYAPSYGDPEVDIPDELASRRGTGIFGGRRSVFSRSAAPVTVEDEGPISVTSPVVDRVRQDYDDMLGGSADLLGLPSSTASPLTFTPVGEESAPAPVTYDRSLVFDDKAPGEGGTGALTNVGPPSPYEVFDTLESLPFVGPPAPGTGGLGSVVDLLREGDVSGALGALRGAIGTLTVPTVDEQPFVGPLPSNVVGTGTPGGMLVDALGNPVLSTSYGLPGEYVPSGPTLDPALLELAAAARGMTVDELRSVIDAELQSGSPVGTTGLTRETLEALQEKGFGGREVSPTQTVDQALAAMQTDAFLTEYLPTILSTFGPPGTGAFFSGVRTIGDLMQGKLSPGAAITRELIGLLARQANIPASVLTNILEGKFGDAAANQAKSFMFSTLSQEAGMPGSAIGMIANELGFLNPLTGQIDRAVTNVIPDQNFGIPGRVAAGIDQFVGPIQSTVSQGLGALGDAAQTGLTGLGDFLGQIGQGIQTGVGAITGGIGNVIDAVTGGGTAAVDDSGVGGVGPNEFQFNEDRTYDTVADDSGVGGVDPNEFEFVEDRVYDTVTDDSGASTVTEDRINTGLDDGTIGYEESLGFTPVVDEIGPKGADVTEDRINTGLDAVDESGVGGVDPDEFEFIEDRIYDTGTDLAGDIDQAVNEGLLVDETGPGGVDVTEERTEDYFTPGTGSVGLPGEELGEGILTGVDPWDQALIDADTGGVYDLDTGTDTGTVDTGVQPGGVTDTDTDTVTDTDTDTTQPPPVIPPTGGGTTLPYGSYFARVPTGYQIVQGPYGPLMQYTYGNLPLGGV